ncbi:MAG: hypothetical protein J5910_03065 [Lachnospiraceae bacterium]|nr:hypothetical protein [Lachnospiraceae bacterium]
MSIAKSSIINMMNSIPDDIQDEIEAFIAQDDTDRAVDFIDKRVLL